MSSLFENKLNKLYESYGILNEGVQSIRPQYQMISDNDFNSLLELDPTYQGGDNLGKYTKWILNLYKKFVKDRQEEEKYKKNLEYKKSHPDAIVKEPVYQSQDRIEDFQKIRHLLTDYEKYKNDIKQDVSSFNSVADLASAVMSAQNKDVSVDEQAMKNYKIFREAMADGLKVVYNGPNFIIGVPTTYEASSHFKSPVTEWCTAYPDRYNYYLRKNGGKYYIHLNKHTGELYQAHYESDQFMDEVDADIDKEDFIYDYPELKDFYDKIWDMNDPDWWVLHNRKPSEEEQINAVKNNGWAIKNIENPSEEVQLAAVRNDGDYIHFIKNPSEKVQIAAIKQNPLALYFIKNPSEKIKIEAIKMDPSSIQFIKNPTEEMQLAAIQQNGRLISYIKDPSEKLQLIAVNTTIDAIDSIRQPSEKVQMAVINNPKYEIDDVIYNEEDQQYDRLRVRFRTPNNRIIGCIINNPTEKVIQLAKEKASE